MKEFWKKAQGFEKENEGILKGNEENWGNM